MLDGIQYDKELEPLFEKAEKEGLWFYANAMGEEIWLSPKQLREQRRMGRFVWGDKAWTLRNPHDGLAYLRRQVRLAELEAKQFERRMRGEP